MSKQRNLTQDEKDLIQQHTIEQRAQGIPDAQIWDELQYVLPPEISRGQIKAQAAWVRYAVTRAMKQQNSSPTIAQKKDPTSQKDSFQRKQPSQHPAKQSKRSDNPPSLPQVVTPSGPKRTNASPETYTNALKEEWSRRAVFGPIREWIPAQERAHRRMLILSGVAGREIPYLIHELGYTPSNITAYEGTNDEELRRQFLAMCQYHGIVGRAMMLEEGVFREQPFDDVLLDRHGNPAAGNVQEMLRSIPVRDRAFIMLNQLAARESTSAQFNLLRSSLDIQRQALERHLESGGSRADFGSQQLVAEAQLQAQSNPNAYKEFRSQDLNREFMESMGRMHVIANKHLARVIPTSPRWSIERKRVEYDTDMTARMYLAHKLMKEIAQSMGTLYEPIRGVQGAKQWMEDTIMSAAHLLTIPGWQYDHYRKFSYNSESSKTRPPYFTDVAMVHRPDYSALDDDPIVVMIVKALKFIAPKYNQLFEQMISTGNKLEMEIRSVLVDNRNIPVKIPLGGFNQLNKIPAGCTIKLIMKAPQMRDIEVGGLGLRPFFDGCMSLEKLLDSYRDQFIGEKKASEIEREKISLS